MKSWLERRWYSAQPTPLALRPLAALYGRIAAARRARLRARAQRVAAPVIVVGNISLGGTGKTPFVIWLVGRLRDWGWRPGVVSRGYGGRSAHYPLLVTADTDVASCGDEPLLMARRTGCPVAVAPDRVAAARALLETGQVDLVVADDGLQHYRLARDLEICVVDGRRGLGNGALLPAGPLREPPARLGAVDLIVVNGGGWRPVADLATPVIDMDLMPSSAWHLRSARTRALDDFAGCPLHAVAGIGHPLRFFTMLERAGLQVRRHFFADHHAFESADLDFGDQAPVLMTEKDAVKCAKFADDRCWAVAVDATIDAADEARLRRHVAALRTAAPVLGSE